MAQQVGGSKKSLAQTVATLSLVLMLLASVFSSVGALAPIVETGVSPLSPDGKHVGVNVPPFFTMELDTRGPLKGLRMSQSVMSGLVKINMDRERSASGKMRGPIDVRVGGMTMYNNQEPPLSSS